MRHNYYYLFKFSLYTGNKTFTKPHHFNPKYTFTQLLSKVFLNKYKKKKLLRSYVKNYDKMHYEEELDLFCSCIRANISIMLHKTIYEINSTPLLRTSSSVCNNLLLQSHVEFDRLLLLKYAIYSLLYRCTN